MRRRTPRFKSIARTLTQESHGLADRGLSGSDVDCFQTLGYFST